MNSSALDAVGLELVIRFNRIKNFAKLYNIDLTKSALWVTQVKCVDQ